MQWIRTWVCGRNHFRFIGLVLVLALVQVSASIAQQAPETKADPKSNGSPTAGPASTPAAGDARPSIPGFDTKTMMPLYETIQEDWSSLEIGTSKLEPEKPLVGTVDEMETYTRSLVQVKWRPGDPLDLWIVVPKGVKKPPVVLYLYDMGWDTDRFHDDGWCKRVTAGGVAAVGFVAALSGHRFHDRPMSQSFFSELQEALGSTVHDVKFILDYLTQRGDVDMNRVGMFGQGSGGAIAILAAAADTRIKAVDALDPWGDWPVFLAKSPMVDGEANHKDYVKADFLKKVAPLDPVRWLPQLKQPIRIQQVHENSSTPIECKDAIKAAAPKQAEVVRFEAMADLGVREGQGRLFDWIKGHLQDASGSGATVSAANVGDARSQRERP